MPLPRIDVGMVMIIGIDNNDNNIDSSNIDIYIDNAHIDNRGHTFLFLLLLLYFFFSYTFYVVYLFIFSIIFCLFFDNCKRTKK